MITYRPFKINEIDKLDALFKRSMLSVTPNIINTYLFILNYYKYLLFLLLFILPINYIIYFSIIVPFIFYIGIKLFLILFVYSHFPSYYLHKYIENNNNILLILKNDTIIGFSSYFKLDNTTNIAWLQCFYIDPIYHKKGYGRKLLHYTCKNIKETISNSTTNNNTTNKYIIGGISTLQYKFWEKCTNKIVETDSYIFNTIINKKILLFFPIKGYTIYLPIN